MRLQRGVDDERLRHRRQRLLDLGGEDRLDLVRIRDLPVEAVPRSVSVIARRGVERRGRRG